MPQVSKYPLSGDVAERIFSIFIKTLVTVKDKTDADDFASDLFTPTEKIMFAKRIAIALLLLKGYQYREISKILKVSLGTIATVNMSIRKGKGSYEKILKKIMQEENLEDFFHKAAELLLSIPAASTKGAGGWRYLHEEVKKSKQNKSSF